MPYRRTENVARRLAEREQTILGAAHSIVGEKGMGAVQIAAVAQRADIAAGTIYRYFPSKNDLVGEVIAAAGAARTRRQCMPPAMRRRDRFGRRRLRCDFRRKGLA